jgi:hypothetical protein
MLTCEAEEALKHEVVSKCEVRDDIKPDRFRLGANEEALVGYFEVMLQNHTVELIQLA